jgi:TetR/AcrR family transcriptional repressor of nem operon
MEMREQILASAQRLVQQRGFNGFSYADVAEEVGIRKASLHHYFPGKTDLGQALIDSYTAQLEQALRHVNHTTPRADAKLQAYAGIYRASLEAGRMCLGGMLAADALTLDPAMLPSLKGFFARNTEWLTEVLAAGQSQRLFKLTGSAADHARMFLSALQGALLIARATGDQEAFARTASLLIADLMRKG